MHRFSLVAILLLFGHIISITAVRKNLLFTSLLTLYVGFVIACNGWMQLKNRMTTHTLRAIELMTESVYKVEFILRADTPLIYRAGQYIFVSFINSLLPKERHPFSLVSAPAVSGSALTVMAKQLGDCTQKLDLLQAGDRLPSKVRMGIFGIPALNKASIPLSWWAEVSASPRY